MHHPSALRAGLSGGFALSLLMAPAAPAGDSDPGGRDRRDPASTCPGSQAVPAPDLSFFHERPRKPATDTLRPEPGLRILLKNSLGHRSLRDAALGALQRMDRPDCRQVFDDFADGSGRSLRQRLDGLEQTPDEWLSGLVFADAAASGFCRPGIMAFTEPGSRVVHVCPRFAEAQRRDARRAEIVLIHELLHTLGLEEDPPPSAEITARVARRCGR